MSDRANALIVTLEEDTRADDEGLAATINAIRRLRGVAHVSINVSDSNHHIAVEVARSALVKKVAEALSR